MLLHYFLRSALLITLFFFASHASGGISIRQMDTYTDITPFGRYSVTLHYDVQPSTGDAPAFLITLKHPANNWATLASAVVQDTEQDNWEKIWFDLGPLPACGCVWEVRALENYSDPYGGFYDITWREVDVYFDDTLVSMEHNTTVVPGTQTSVDVNYIAEHSRDLLVELITADDALYRSSRITVSAGSGSVSLDLPIPQDLSAEDAPYITTKLLPVDADWQNYLSQIYQPVSVTEPSFGYKWPFPLDKIERQLWDGGNPWATSYITKIGALNSDFYTEISLPNVNSDGIYTEAYDVLKRQAWVLDLYSGDIYYITQSRPSPSGAFSAAEYQIIREPQDHNGFTQLLSTMASHIETQQSRMESYPETDDKLTKAIAYLDRIRSQ